MKSYNTIGKSIPRLDAPLQVTGRLVYGEDMYRPNMLYAAAKYSDHMHDSSPPFNTCGSMMDS